MISFLLWSLGAPRDVLIYARVGQDHELVIEKALVGPSGLLEKRTLVTIQATADVSLDTLSISPAGKFFFVFARHKKSLRREMLMFDATLFKITDRRQFAGPTPTPFWVSADQIIVRAKGENEQDLAITVSKTGKLTDRVAVGSPLPKTSHAKVAEQALADLMHSWPSSPHGPLEFRALQFDNRRGTAVISVEGDVILVSVRDAESATGAKSLMIERRGDAWTEYVLGAQRFPVFALWGRVIALQESNLRKCTLFSRDTRKQIGQVACDIFDLGPLTDER